MSDWSAWRFASPLFFVAVVLLAPIVYAGLVGASQGRVRFSALSLVRATRGGRHRLFRVLPLVLRGLAVFALVVALARPQGGNVSREVTSEGTDIMLVADTSGSMEAMDFTLGGKRATRLDVAKKVIRDFIAERENDRIGLLVFGEEAFVQCPNTIDYGVLVNTLDAVKLKMAGDGTAIGTAIGVGVQRLKDLPGRTRIMILLTDGENTTGILEPLQAARAAATYGIKIYTIGVGTQGEAPFLVPGLLGMGKRFHYQKVNLDEGSLKAIANATGARYFRATSTEKLQEIYALIDQLEKTEVKVREFTDYHELYTLALWPALLLLLLEQLLRATWLRTLP
jgi:Ca-activated chloride channel family protein